MQATKRNRAKIIKLLLIGVLFLTVTTAAKAEPTLKDEIRVQRIDYLIENIHPSYWAKNEESIQLFCNLFIYMDDLKNQLETIEQVAIFNKYNTKWELDLKKDFNLERGFLGGYLRLYDTILSQNSTLWSLSDLKLVFTLKNGKEVTKPFSIPVPGFAEPTAKSQYIYNENFRGRVLDSYVPALKMGVITSLEYRENAFKVSFTANDNRIANGYFAFYDKDKNYVGETPPFTNWYSGEVADFLNQGKRFDITGKINNAEFGVASIQLGKRQKVSKIKYVQLCLTDGFQFAKSAVPNNYIYTSYSEMTPVVKK